MKKPALYLRLMRMDRPIGAFLLLWPTLWAVWIAGNGQPSARIVLIMSLGVFIMRAAGCVINDFADRNFDGHVNRTKQRPLASGELTAKNALFVFFALALLALILVLQLNTASLIVATFALAIAVLYPFCKRVTYLPQFILGLAFSMGIPMAFTAQQGVVPMLAYLLLTANLLWVVAYDTIYAMVDKEDDVKIGIKSTAILFGRYDINIVLLLGIASLLILFIIGLKQHFNLYYFGGLVLAFSNLLYQQWLLRSKGEQKKSAQQFQAFLSNNWFGAFVFAGLVLNYL